MYQINKERNKSRYERTIKKLNYRKWKQQMNTKDIEEKTQVINEKKKKKKKQKRERKTKTQIKKN